MGCANCLQTIGLRKAGSGKIRARTTAVFSNNSVAIKSTSSIRAANSTFIVLENKLSSSVKFVATENFIFAPNRYVSYDNSNLSGKLTIDENIRARVSSSSSLINSFTAKYGGALSNIRPFLSFVSNEKLYPVKDLVVQKGGNFFANESASSGDIYQSIDEGIFEGGYDDANFIQPSSIYTVGSYQYKCRVTDLYKRPEHSYLLIRAISPTFTRSSKLPPIYKLSNIILEDPSGNLIIKYKDVNIKGDANYDNPLINYVTYITEPEINYGKLNTWEDNYPVLGSGRTDVYTDASADGYTLNINLDIECLDDPFDGGFNLGYEEKSCELQELVNYSDNDHMALDGEPISTQSSWYQLNPYNHTLRISSIEIANSGQAATLTSHYLPVNIQVPASGNRITKTILPAEVLVYDYDTGIYPDVDTIWESSSFTNASGEAAHPLATLLRNTNNNTFITSSDPQSNGKLKLKFKDERPVAIDTLRDGSLNIGWFNNEFDTAYLKNYAPVDGFYTIDAIELKVVAKKEVGVSDYVLDIVGYSDDKLLNSTSSVGGFLQNTEGTGNLPPSSGFNANYEMALSEQAISEEEQYFASSGTNNAGGDHYKLATTPVISSTEFQEYTIPLTIYEDNVSLGKSIDYSMSSYFENLYVDIYPIPSGASISSIKLVVSYKPSNAIMLHTVGHGVDEFYNRTVTLIPTSGNADMVGNSGDKLSIISNIPHAYSTSEETLKTNYSRRWRGSAGDKVVSAFNIDQFDYSFDKDFIQFPFIDYYDFSNITSSSVLPFNISDKVTSNEILVSGNINVKQNLGSRFITSDTIDWTYEGDALYGKISDAFDSAIRLSGVNSYLYTNEVGNLYDGFAAFIRFAPDSNVSGVGYNLFNSGVLFSQFDSSLGYALAFDNGYLTAYAKDNYGTIVKIQDSITYDKYNYPLSVFLTYNEDGNSTLKLYSDNESAESFVTLRAESDSFTILDPPANALTVGYSAGSGVGMNMFVSDFGISFFETDEIIIDKINEDNVNNFFDSIRMPFANKSERYRLWDRINQNTDNWHLGAFKICEFNQDFDRFTTRIGSDYVFHYLNHSGSGYAEYCDVSLPSSIPSGIAYHTQIENDMLRFNIGEGSLKHALYSPIPRINKNLTRGYNYAEDALAIDTILEHDTYNDIVWSDGKVGPRLIVSLYTPIKEPQTYPSTNYGLINRQIHYLEPSGCWRKIRTVFDPNSFFDETTEPWSNFAESQRITEFNHKYFSSDIDDMFIQYDLSYPSGSAFESTIKLHSINVKLVDALITASDASGNFNLVTSGNFYENQDLNLNMPNVEPLRGDLNLFAAADILGESSGTVNIFVSGGLYTQENLPLYTLNIRTIDNVNGDSELYGSANTYGLPMFVSGQYFDDEHLPLVIENKLEDQSSSGTLSLAVFNKLDKYTLTDSIGSYIRGASSLVNFVPSSSMSLYVSTPPIGKQDLFESMNLYVSPLDPKEGNLSGVLSLFTVNYAALNKQENQSESINWNSTNVGKDIELDDNDYASLAANDEIRGVDITCYGDCDDGGICEEAKIITHDTVWNDSTCVYGGIFRASNVYTNLDVGYSGDFYGIRKYDGLIPNAPYKISVFGKTADGDLINVPRELDAIEYGRSETATHSGVKLIGDDPYAASGRNEGDQYGKSLSVKSDLMVVGAPMHDILDSGGNTLSNAGAVFVYRRNPEPSGSSWSYDKAAWEFETKLSLPFASGDYVDRVESFSIKDTNGNTIATAPQTFWAVGQDGRQLGHSVDVAQSDRELIVAGGPSAQWNRTFVDYEPTGVNIGLMIFTDGDGFKEKFIIPGSIPIAYKTYEFIRNAIRDKDILFKYCTSPFPVKFNVNVMLCLDMEESISFSVDTDNLDIYSKKIPKNISSLNNGEFLSGVKQIFTETFPHDPTLLNSGIPPLLGIFVDNGGSYLGDAPQVQAEINKFIDYYQEYSFASGLVDFDENPATGAAFLYSNTKEDWIDSSIDILDNLLDTGRLIQDDQFRFFADEIVKPDGELAEFNVPPPSGGVVYIFEKESGNWNLIQEIKSPTDSNAIAPDRFGHDVKISSSGDLIVIGSPYISDAVTVYQYDSREKERMYNNVEAWVTYHAVSASSYYSNLKSRFNVLKSQYGKDHASRLLYLELTPEAKHDLRNNNDFWKNRGGGAAVVDYSEGYYEGSKVGTIQEYQKIYTYGYGNISYLGGEFGGFLLEQFAPTSRLGYSVATNEDGSIVVAGAPTDSFNEYDDADVYYFQKGNGLGATDITQVRENSTFFSYTNAGAVRVFESRNYYPHSIAIEYGKFGNLAYENREEGEDNYFNHMQSIFASEGRTFIQTPFAEVDIPEEAGLVFIITPAIDALSDEVMTNIKNWLALGDRHLVLVGDDPTYERNGLYKQSNDLINRILEGLDSRMILQPARNEYEALVSGCPDLTKPNVLPSFKPSKSRSTYISTGDMFAYGVGDIRMKWNDERTYSCTLSNPANDGDDDSYEALNGKFKLPMINNRDDNAEGGDLRAQWAERCYNIKGNPITFQQNWALLLGTVTERDYGCYDGNDDPPPVSKTFGYDPVPLLAAAEYPEPVTIVYPATPPASSLQPIYETYPKGETIIYKFADVLDDVKQFAWSEQDTDYIDNSYVAYGSFEEGAFYNPEPEENKDAVLQARSVTRFERKKSKVQVLDEINYAAKESVGQQSEVYLIAGLTTENVDEFIFDGGGVNMSNPADNDAGAYFYDGILAVTKLQGTSIKIAQLGGWTGRNSMSSVAFVKSFLEKRFPAFSVTENVASLGLSNVDAGDGDSYDICWISNPTGLPSGEELEAIKTWLALGNKKLIITYETDGIANYVGEAGSPNVGFDEIRHVVTLCGLLGLTMKPVYLETKAEFALHTTDGDGVSDGDNILTPDLDKIDYLVGNKLGKSFVPINKGDGVSIARIPKAILDDSYEDVQLWEMKTSPVKIDFETLPGSGYKLFVDVYSKNIKESEPIFIGVNNCSSDPQNDTSFNAKYDLFDSQGNMENNKLTVNVGLSTSVLPTSVGSSNNQGENEITTREYNIKATSNKISVYFSTPYDQTENEAKTTRLFSVSGCLLNIEEDRITQYGTRISGYEWVITSNGTPEQTFTYQPPFREISTDNTKYSPYCGSSCQDDCLASLGNQLIADGPVVVAQELEQFSTFENGENRSRITVISDSSLIQGRCMADENGVINPATVRFIKSLYPPSPSRYITRGRQFTTATKIINQERSSPQKLFSSTGNTGHNLLFKGTSNPSSGTSMEDFNEYVYQKSDDLERPLSIEGSLEYDFRTKLPEGTERTEEDIQRIKDQIISEFQSIALSYGATSKFSGIIDGTLYSDASYLGGIPQIMTDTGYDYLDFNRFPSGYPGDLFGYSVAIYGDKIVVGSPFAPFEDEELITWSGVSSITNSYTRPSGMSLGFNGGAGAVYVFEKTGSGTTIFGNPSSWECTRKLRPDSINVGQDVDDLALSELGIYLGPHNYDADDITNLSIINDQFGHSVDIHSDTIIVGAPGHDFENYVYESGGAFRNKDFGIDANISIRELTDVGNSGVRNNLLISGSGTTAVLNNGAVYVFENRITDWINKAQSWQFVEKIVPHGYNARLQKTPSASGSENDYFGKSLSIDRTRRTDADYTIAVGTPHHKFATSGNHITGEPLADAGAAYMYDAVLRERSASKADSETFIDATVFGSGIEKVKLTFANGSEYNKQYEATGVIYANPQGEIFLEASGRDPTLKGFIKHRPYIDAVKGGYVFGTPVDEAFRLYTIGQPPISSGDMNLFMNCESGIVYNTLGLYEQGIADFSSGNLSLYTESPSGETSDSINLYVGIGNNTETLNLRIRGK
jgi:hypothetical protein